MQTIIARHEKAAAVLPKPRLLVGHRDLTDSSGGSMAHVNPTTGRGQAEVLLAGRIEADAVVDVARAAFPAWRATPAAVRRDLLLRLADLVQRDAEQLATLAALENGTIRQIFLHAHIPLVCNWLRYYAGWADKIAGDFAGGAGGGAFDFVVPEPVGVVVTILPWNAPLPEIGMKCAPALAAGNAVIAKPSELAPFLAIRLGELAREAGFPEGVFNVLVGGPEAGDALVRSPGVNKISFTGSPATARRIQQSGADLIRPALFELGGKSAGVVFPDADLDKVAAFSATLPFSHAGQICISPSRLIVHADVYDSLIEKMVAVANSLVVGDPLDEQTFVGPMMTEPAVRRVLDHVDRAVSRDGVRLIAGGRRKAGVLADGFFVEPTIIGDPDPQSELSQTELFGPVVAVHAFRTEEEATALANGTEYGLVAYVHTGDLNCAFRLSRSLEAGGVYVNQAFPIANPNQVFGGVGDSGYGREGGRAGLEEFIRLKAVSINVEAC